MTIISRFRVRLEQMVLVELHDHSSPDTITLSLCVSFLALSIFSLPKAVDFLCSDLRRRPGAALAMGCNYSVNLLLKERATFAYLTCFANSNFSTAIPFEDLAWFVGKA